MSTCKRPGCGHHSGVHDGIGCLMLDCECPHFKARENQPEQYLNWKYALRRWFRPNDVRHEETHSVKVA